MEQMVINEWNAGKDIADITTELFDRFARPDMWQETYRKVQQMIAQGQVA